MNVQIQCLLNVCVCARIDENAMWLGWAHSWHIHFVGACAQNASKALIQPDTNQWHDNFAIIQVRRQFAFYHSIRMNRAAFIWYHNLSPIQL